jgi:RNA polymerase sigma factor (sigma-70 family)
MLSAGTRQDAEDVMQDVFVRAYAALRADRREMNVRAWLYRVAHNRCIDQMRRPVPAPAELFEVSRRPLHDPLEEAQRREDLTRLVSDIARLPQQQRSALLMREIDGMSYQDLAEALDVTVPAIKSLLVRARMGLVEAAEARDADCAEIRRDLLAAYDRGVKASGHARRHMRTCAACAEYRTALRGVRRSFAALAPVGFGPLALVANLLGIGGGGAGAAAGAGAGGSAASAVAATATACKVAAVVCTAAITAGGAVEANHLVQEQRTHHRAHPAAVKATAPAVPAAAPRTAGPVIVRHTAVVVPAPAATPVAEEPAVPVDETLPPDDTTTTDPAATPTPEPTTTPAAGEDGTTGTPTDATTGTPPADPAAGTDGAQPAPSPAAGEDTAETASATPVPAPSPTPSQPAS